MGIIKFLDAHSGTILTICIIAHIAGIVMNFKLQKRRREVEKEAEEQKAALQEFHDKYFSPSKVRLESPEYDMLHRVYHMCRHIIIRLGRFEDNKDWSMENGFCFFGCEDILTCYNDTYDKTKKYGINCEFYARIEDKGLSVFVDLMWDDKKGLKDGKEIEINFIIYTWLLVTTELIDELDKMGLDPSEKVKDDVFLSALKDAVRNKFKKI